jgi:hypothetical protein
MAGIQNHVVSMLKDIAFHTFEDPPYSLFNFISLKKPLKLRPYTIRAYQVKRGTKTVREPALACM